MNQSVTFQTLPRQWDFLEPAMNPNKARLKHVKIKLAASGTTVSYGVGQIICGKDDGTNEYAKLGVAGYTLSPKAVKYPFTVDDAGNMQYGDAIVSGYPQIGDSIEVYYSGIFKTQDLLPSGLVDDATAKTVGNLISGTRTAGMIDLGVGTPN